MAKKVDYSVEERLRALYDLQLIDSRIDKLRSVRGELPLEVQDLEDEVSGLEVRVEKVNGEIGDLENLIFLSIENKFSKQGYQINEIKKYGEISGLLLWELIIKKPIKKPSKYAPLSPSIKILKMFSNKSSKRVNIIKLID